MSRNVEMRRSMLAELLEGQPATKKQKTRPSAPVSTLMLDGQRALDERRYKDAVQHFTEAIGNLHDRKADLLHIYDLCGSTYIKLKQFEDALKDAKQMIRLDRADARGYLKCAQVEQLRSNLAGAIKICEYGLKTVPSSDKGHSRLEACLIRVKELAKKSIVLEKGTDPMEVLPTELLDMVVASFEYRQAIAIMRVSKVWRSRLMLLDVVAQTIDTRHSKRTVTYEQMKAAFARLGKMPRSVALAKLNEHAARFASAEMSRWVKWPTLETLVIDEGKIDVTKFRFEKYSNLRNLAMASGVEVHATARELLGRCPALQQADLRCGLVTLNDPSLHSWTINHNVRDLRILCPTKQQPLHISFRHDFPYPNIQRLELGNVVLNAGLYLSSCSDLKELSLQNAVIKEDHNLRTPPSLECFVLEGPFANIFPQPEEIKMPAATLHTISVKGSESIRFLAYAIRQGLTKNVLRNFSMSDFVTYSNVAGRHIGSDLNLLRSIPGTEELEEVESLALKDDNITDNDLTVIHSLFPTFQHLDLEAPEITEVFVSELLRLPNTKVQTISLRNCNKVSADIVRWCKLRNVDVKLIRQSRPDDSFGGRRVRYY